MASIKIGVSIDANLLAQLDDLVAKRVFASRSQAVQVALREMIVHRKRHRLAEECSKLDPAFEQAMAEEGLSEPLADY